MHIPRALKAANFRWGVIACRPPSWLRRDLVLTWEGLPVGIRLGDTALIVMPAYWFARWYRPPSPLRGALRPGLPGLDNRQG